MNNEAAIDARHLPGNELRVLAGKERYGIFHLMGLAEAAYGMRLVPGVDQGRGSSIITKIFWLSGVMIMHGAMAFNPERGEVDRRLLGKRIDARPW